MRRALRVLREGYLCSQSAACEGRNPSGLSILLHPERSWNRMIWPAVTHPASLIYSPFHRHRPHSRRLPHPLPPRPVLRFDRLLLCRGPHPLLQQSPRERHHYPLRCLLFRRLLTPHPGMALRAPFGPGGLQPRTATETSRLHSRNTALQVSRLMRMGSKS